MEMLSFDFYEFQRTGGVAAREREAAARAVADERRLWLAVLEAYAASRTEEEIRRNQLGYIVLISEIRRLRKLLRRPPPVPDAETIAKRRAQTAERVRRHRLRRREAA